MSIKGILDSFAFLVACLWVGSMWAIGFIAAPVLFKVLEDKSLAGMLAGNLFTVTTYVGVTCAVMLLGYAAGQTGKQVLKQKSFWLVAAMLLITLAGHWGIQPVLAELKALALPQYVMESAYADRFRMWHGISSMAFMLQSILGLLLLLNKRCKVHFT